jgi:hypothetical protein
MTLRPVIAMPVGPEVSAETELTYASIQKTPTMQPALFVMVFVDEFHNN